MDQASLIELIQNGFSHAGDHAMNGTTLFFAFLTMSYFVGEQLTRFQAWAVSALYTVFLLLPSFALIREMGIALKLISEFHASFPDKAPLYFPIDPQSNYFMLPIGTLLFISWATSIGLLIHVRTNGQANDS